MGLAFDQFASNKNQQNEIDDFDFGGVAKNEEAKEEEFNFNFGSTGDAANKNSSANNKPVDSNNLINLLDDFGGPPQQPAPAQSNNNQNDFFSNMGGRAPAKQEAPSNGFDFGFPSSGQ